MFYLKFFLLLSIMALEGSNAAIAAADTQSITSHAIAMNDDPKYSPQFTHFDYVNPTAPKGGQLRLAIIGTFDSLNPYIAKGNSAGGLGQTYDTLMVGSDDEPFTQYGLVAEKIEYPEDRTWVIFHINPKARFQDGAPIKASDVKFTFKILTEKGSPLYARYYGDVAGVEVLDDRRVKFDFGGKANRELPLILGQLPVLPEHYWKTRDFGRTTLAPPLGSGPYKIASVDQGRSISYTLDENYWGKDLPVNRGKFNFERMRYDYYRDAVVALAAFKSGEFDFRVENISKQWATEYKGPPFKKGLIKKETIRHGMPAGMQCFVMNQRRSLFKDRRVRYALAHAFDFEWTNQHLFYSMYQRTDSYFENSEMQADGPLPKAVLEILEPFRDDLWPEVFTRDYSPPSTTGELGLRNNLREALKLLREAGWEVKNGMLRHTTTGKPFIFELLLDSPSWERIALPFVTNLKKLGIYAKVRLVDSSQYINRVRNFDFDMIVEVFGQSLSPGNEQRWFWHSEAAKVPGTHNYCGIQNKAIDHLVELVITAKTREELINRCKALDQALLWGHYVIPHWYSGGYNVAYSNKLKHPENLPLYGLSLDIWWSDPVKKRTLKKDRKMSAE
jgi:microcin C transport system substrate-binding protein